MKSVLLLQAEPTFPTLVTPERMRLAVDTLLSLQNETGGYGSYETARAGEWMEQLNAAEVFGRIMVCDAATLGAWDCKSDHETDWNLG